MQQNNSDVAIVYYQPIQKLITVGENQYAFMVRGNISLSPVKPEDVDKVLAIKGGCCGHKKSGVFRIATEQQQRIWKNNGGS